MTFDDLKMNSMKDQPDQKSFGKKAKGLRLLSSPCWCPAAITLGILSLGLLVTLILLRKQLFQVSDLLKQSQANLTHQENILKGQLLAQQQAEKRWQNSQRELRRMIDTLYQKLDERSKEKIELHKQNLGLQEALARTENYSGPCPQDWIWHGENCYLFSSGMFNWQKSSKNCSALGAQLLKINNKGDLDFIREATSHSNLPFWMGLRLQKPGNLWHWEDSSPLRPHLFKLQGAFPNMYSSDTCAYIQRGDVFRENCILIATPICQKSADLLWTQ
ncbi:oxidized low-density lipoprotein receptor 1 isoform X2 [Fukomys damarensis]|nr:oxidized low-density lipoprotein receptor 1 isoform X2 [Fukomys damarensis]